MINILAGISVDGLICDPVDRAVYSTFPVN